MTKYTKEILSGFARIGYTPRGNQVESIDRIVKAFVDDGFTNVVLSAPPGIGKSIIGAVTAEVCAELAGQRNLKSLILMQNNMLVNQYQNSFGSNSNFSQIKGAVNYSCAAIPALPGFEATAEECIKVIQSIQNPICNSCEYNISSELKNTVDHLITNYSYYFVSKGISLKARYMTIWDEAHTINEVFCNYNSTVVTSQFLDSLRSDCNMVSIKKTLLDILESIRNRLQNGEISEITYEDDLENLSEIYKELVLIATEAADEYFSKNEMEKYVKFTRLSKKYSYLISKIEYILENEHIFQVDETEFSVKPIFIGEKSFYSSLNDSRKNLFMSATVSKKIIVETVGVKDEETTEIILDPVFDPVNKKMIFMKPIPLNNTSLQEPDTIKHIAGISEAIVGHHKNDCGIILTPSFKLTGEIAEYLRKNKNINVLEHVRGSNINEIIDIFKSSVGNTVLISPSIFEGLSLDDELCRYQILVKAPFPSLADKRIMYIMTHHREVYDIMTLQKIIQGAGRAVRNENDHAVTYALDMNIKRLFNSKLNVWKNEFQILEF
jgi:Rad3-related DNA helicase